jgi:hypothetical protein
VPGAIWISADWVQIRRKKPHEVSVENLGESESLVELWSLPTGLDIRDGSPCQPELLRDVQLALT